MTDVPLKTLTKAHATRYTDRGSRFYAYAFPVMDLQAIESRRTDIADKHPDATHHCYAWRYNPFQPEEFAQDDGEPAGTAGLPILGVIKSALLVNVLIIVVRYFGGTKLGKAGLILAYREAAALSIASADKKSLDRFIPFSVCYPYDQENRIRELINRFRMDIAQETYLENVSMTLYCKADHAAELAGSLEQLAHLGITFQKKPEFFRPVDDNTPN
ncbi:MAG: DUF1949 domain-containing protein [Balneolaceae bacterium]|nr:MAG: DUF1949 domain-containing protein [Balneolaceae bacterium]